MAERLEKPSEGLPQSTQPEKIHKTSDPRPHSVTLDALRGIAILGIVVNHAKSAWENSTKDSLSGVSTWNSDLLNFYIAMWGPFSLALFFLLSGYLLTWTEGRRASRGNYSLRSYAFRRALRLVPAYYTALALIYLVRVTDLLGGNDPTLPITLIYLGALQSFVPIPQTNTGFDSAYWYLTSEVVFYALLPLLVLKLRGLYARLAVFGVLVAMALTIEVFIYVSPYASSGYMPYYLYGLPFTHLWIFMAGVLLRTLVERLEERGLGGSWPALAFSLFAGSLTFFALLAYVPLVRDAVDAGEFIDVTSIMFFAALSFFAAALLGSPVLSRILSWRLLGFVGVISYSFYLLHDTFLLLVGRYVLRSRPVRQMIAQLDGAAVWLAFGGYLGVVLVVAVALSYLGYRYIESPFLKYKPK